MVVLVAVVSRVLEGCARHLRTADSLICPVTDGVLAWLRVSLLPAETLLVRPSVSQSVKIIQYCCLRVRIAGARGSVVRARGPHGTLAPAGGVLLTQVTPATVAELARVRPLPVTRPADVHRSEALARGGPVTFSSSGLAVWGRFRSET